MRVFISGGCKNGKSTYAQMLAKRQAASTPLYYIATMVSADHEDTARILRHQQEREGWGFTTVEQPTDITAILDTCDPSGSFLLDSTTALLANEMFTTLGTCDDTAFDRLAQDLTCILDRVHNIVIVSDYIYSDAMQYDSFTEEYRRHLGALDCLLAAKCDVVLEAAYTQIITHKGAGLI